MGTGECPVARYRPGQTSARSTTWLLSPLVIERMTGDQTCVVERSFETSLAK